jgi:hypothetical protein
MCLPVYVHAKLCVVDDVWAAVGSDNFNTRSWTHDSELTAAVLDSELDGRAPIDPGGLGDGARRFARELRLAMMREHLGLDEDEDLLDPVQAADTVRKSAAELDAWHDNGRRGRRPAGFLRSHPSAKKESCPPGIAGSPHRCTGPSSTRTVARSGCDCGAPTDSPVRSGREVSPKPTVRGQSGAVVDKAASRSWKVVERVALRCFRLNTCRILSCTRQVQVRLSRKFDRGPAQARRRA